MTSTPQNALAVTTAFAPRGGYRSPFAALFRTEARRIARHPALLVGVTLGIGLTAPALVQQADRVTSDALGMQVLALTVGLGAMLSAFHLTRSLHRADELLEASPTSRTVRTGALCLAAVVPALIALLWLAFYYGVAPAALNAPEWMYGPFSHVDVAAVIVGNSLVACVGGTLLGVAAGRWWRFRAASVVLVLGVAVWTLGVLAAFGGGNAAPAEWNRWVRLFTPVGYFTASNDNTSVLALTGSPWWYLWWLLTLCALAAVAALLWRSEGATRRRVIRAGVIVLALSLMTYAAAASGGLSHEIRTYPDGHRVVLMPK